MKVRRDITRRRSGPVRITTVLVLLAVLALVTAACGSSKRESNETDNSTTTAAGGSPGVAPLIDTSACTDSMTTGIEGDTIKLGTSLPQSGLYSAFTKILNGGKAYFSYINDQGGVTVDGKKYKIELVAKDDQYDASKTVTNVQQLINDDKVFGLFNVVGTKNNLAIRNLVSQRCVPLFFAASGATQWGNHDYPWLIGSELVPYPLEVKAMVDYLKVEKPDATIAVLRANDDFGASYTDTLEELVKGTQLKVVQTQQYDSAGADVTTQVNSLAATKADVFLLAAALLACPTALNAAQEAGWKPIIYMSGTCISKTLLTASGAAAEGVLTVTPLLDPADPGNDSNPAMKLYREQFEKYFPKAADKLNDSTDGIVAYGWTTAALFVKTLESAAKLDRASVMEAARTLKDVSGVGLQLPNSTWNTSADDWFLGETFQFVKYDSAAGHSQAVGELTVEDGKTAELTPEALINK